MNPKQKRTIIIIAAIVLVLLLIGIGIWLAVRSGSGDGDHQHTPILVEAKAATCTEAGNNAYYRCECGKVFTDEACKKETNLAALIIPAKGHKSEADDGDCTTSILCEVCKEIIVSAKTEHIAHADDGDCTTAVTCTACDVVVVPAKTHNYEGAQWQSDANGHWKVCKNSDCKVTDTKVNHTSSGAATEEAAETCTVCNYVIAPKLEHTHSYTVTKHNDTEHWFECVCGTKSSEPAVPHSATSDNDCMTADKCSCGYTVTAAKDHVAGEDDGNCKTPIGCVNCGNDAVAGRIDHIDADHDYNCDNPDCQITLPGAPKDDNEGIDLPIDRN